MQTHVDAATLPAAAKPGASVSYPLAMLRANPLNPRAAILDDDPEILELVASIRSVGIIDPLHALPDGMLIAGHRRAVAARLAGLHTVPVILRNMGQADQLTLMVVENTQRATLTPLERAHACGALRALSLTQTEIAARVGWSVSYVSYLLRLVAMPGWVLQHVQAGTLSAAQAISLDRFAGDVALLQRLVEGSLRGGMSAAYIDGLDATGAPPVRHREREASYAAPGGYVPPAVRTPEPPPVPSSIAPHAAISAERGAIVDYLRAAADLRGQEVAARVALRLAATEIARGEHLRTGGGTGRAG